VPAYQVAKLEARVAEQEKEGARIRNENAALKRRLTEHEARFAEIVALIKDLASADERFEKLRKLAEGGRKGAQTSVATRRARAERKAAHILELAIAAIKADPARSDSQVASEIEGSWKLKDIDCDSHRWLEGRVASLDKAGKLPPRTKNR
jgi:hypothetical protein